MTKLMLMLLLWTVGGEPEWVVSFQESQIIEPTCEALHCMPDPSISAYHPHWQSPYGANLLARGPVHPDIAKERALRRDETAAVLKRGERYYTRAVPGAVATLRKASLAASNGGYQLLLSVDDPGHPESRALAAQAQARLRPMQLTGGCRADAPCRGRKARPTVGLLPSAAVVERKHVFVLPPPRTKNLYHFICDSILPLSWAISHASGCDNATLVCDPPAEVHVLLPGRLKVKGAVAWLDLLDVIFEGRVYGFGDQKERVVFERVTWGVGESIVYGDFGDRARLLTEAIHGRLQRSYGTPPKKTGEGPVVVYIARGRHGDGRFIDEGRRAVLLTAFLNAGASEATTCCDWGRVSAREMFAVFSRADIVVGLHGAGCSNALFTPHGAVMVELHAAKGASTLTFRRIAAARSGGYVRAFVQGQGRDQGHAFVNDGQPDAIAKCAVATWRNNDDSERDQICFGPSTYIEEAWTPRQMMHLRRPPPRTYEEAGTLQL